MLKTKIGVRAAARHGKQQQQRMSFMNWSKQFQWIHGMAGAILILTLAGCKRESNQVYIAPKEAPPAPMATPPPGGMPPADMSAPAGLPTLAWTLPDGWQQKPAGEMRVASFSVAGSDGQAADVSVIPLPGIGGMVLENVNRWRGQVSLPPITQADLGTATEPVTIAGTPASLFDMAGMAGGASKKSRILAAMLDHDGMTWFFKMTGDDTLVENQKPAFEKFLASVKFTGAAQASAEVSPAALPPGHPAIGSDMGAPTASVPPPDNSGKPIWLVPSDWHEVPPAQFLLAEYAVAGANGAAADVNVAMLNGEGGGALPNVNRWRTQLGLPTVTESDLPTVTSTQSISGGQATVVDMTGTNPKTGAKARLVGVILPQAGQTWFYKLMGDEQVVEQQKAAFLQFVQSARYPNAP
jgi:hypothetical protein